MSRKPKIQNTVKRIGRDRILFKRGIAKSKKGLNNITIKEFYELQKEFEKQGKKNPR